ncbi:DNA polymerase III PolC-type-like [Mercenaria mercenaria]|uniref:DNA polymerase III PolC-type-like n=1 Tax=Mercenaria mercenaria TaxID=6596 RepID=UPI00234EAA5E|nr:DNA polymerase III PolC-type-like [Mercenaria mercenaria]
MKQCLEVREGPTYQSGIDLEENVDMEAIPAPMYQPCPEDDPIMADDSICMVVFDLETTGLERDSHITELAAETVYSTNNSTDTFHRFIISKKPISNQASKITGITVKGRQLFKNAALVNNSVSVSRALTSFLDFFKQKQKIILVGHNIKTFDSLVLVNALENVNMMEDFRNIVIGFEDTRKLFMINNPELKSYLQENLVGQLLGQEYQAHSASEDVKALKALYTTVDVGKHVHAKCLFSVAYSILGLNYSQRVRRNLPSLQRMMT